MMWERVATSPELRRSPAPGPPLPARATARAPPSLPDLAEAGRSTRSAGLPPPAVWRQRMARRQKGREEKREERRGWGEEGEGGSGEEMRRSEEKEKGREAESIRWDRGSKGNKYL